jgi:hypothetical protein
MRTAGRFAARVVWVGASVAVCAGIGAVSVRSAGLYATLSRLATTRRAVVLQSEVLAPDLYVSETRDEPGPRIRKPWTLLIVVSGQRCRLCAAALLAWENALDRGANVRIRVAAADPGGPERQAVERLGTMGADAALWTIRDRSRFRTRTGVKLVPMALLLDSNATVHLAVSGMPSDHTCQAFKRMIQRQAREGAPGLFEHNTGTDPIQAPISRFP